MKNTAQCFTYEPHGQHFRTLPFILAGVRCVTGLLYVYQVRQEFSSNEHILRTQLVNKMSLNTVCP